MVGQAFLERTLTLKSHHFHKTTTSIPFFLYGTAWKKEATADLVYQALNSGFTGVDTANQPKHYREDLVGAGLRKVIQENRFKREDIYIQTKFTPVSGQDLNNLPYDPKASIPEQVRKSVESSLKHLSWTSNSPSDSDNQSYIDTLVLHSPLASIDETMEAWGTLEGFVPSKIRNLGVSNCNLFTLMDICERATVKPAVVQNRFYSNTKYDIGLRKFCRENSIIYQSFWTLTANPALLRSPLVGQLTRQMNISAQAALYSLVFGLGNIVILNGTQNPQHMLDDFEALEKVRAFASQNPLGWEEILTSFRQLIKELP